MGNAPLPDLPKSGEGANNGSFTTFYGLLRYYRIIRVVAGVTSGSNLWAGALRATAPCRKSELAMTSGRIVSGERARSVIVSLERI